MGRAKVLAFVGLVLIFAPLAGLNAVIGGILKTMLGNPVAGSSGAATVNLIVFALWLVMTVAGLVFAIMGLGKMVRARRTSQ